MAKKVKGAKRALEKIDAKAREAVIPHRRSEPVKALAWYSEIGDQPQLRAISGALFAAGLLTRNSRMMRAGARMLVAHELATAAKNFVKHRVDRTRPRSAPSQDDQKPKPGRNTSKEETSFPSGHSAGAVAVASAFAEEYPEYKLPALTAAGLVAVAQIPRCAHYPTDVGAGVAIGAAANALLGLALPARAPETPTFTVERLQWEDEALGTIPLPGGTMELRASFGSGLTRRASDPPGIVWAVGDRGPNLKIKTMTKRYGADWLEQYKELDGAKVMPRLDLGPAIARLRIAGDRVELVKTLRLKDSEGAPVSGLPVPGGEHARCEPALDLQGARLEPDPSGLDTEGIVAYADGTFVVGDEFGPSLVRLDPEGRVLARFVPEGAELGGANYPIETTLPAIAVKRQLNRGFESIALSPDEKWLFLAFQSPLAHPDEAAHEAARHVRLWRLDARSLVAEAQYLYPLDRPESFRRDSAEGKLDWGNLKVSELACIGQDTLLVLERASETTKIYRVDLDGCRPLPPEHLEIETRPTLEQLSAGSTLFLPRLRKQLVFSSDDAPEVSADLEGMAVLSPTELLLVNDNDFGVEGAETAFWRIRFERPILC